MNDIVHDFLIAIITGGGIGFIESLILRHDEKKGTMESVIERLDKIDKRQDVSERDSCRTQLLILLNHYPDHTEEIMKVAERYFGGLHANWYMTSLFNKWLERSKIGKPEWFDKEE